MNAQTFVFIVNFASIKYYKLIYINKYGTYLAMVWQE